MGLKSLKKDQRMSKLSNFRHTLTFFFSGSEKLERNNVEVYVLILDTLTFYTSISFLNPSTHL